MPVISSITRQPEVNGDDIDLACPPSDGVGEENHARDPTLPDPPEVLSLLSYVDTLDVEQDDLDHIKAVTSLGKPKPGQFGPVMAQLPSEYIIGTGVSSAVMLLTPPKDIEPSTSLVAYKRYTITQHGPVSDKRIYHWLWHELRSLCHPTLREHENICKLKHIAWEHTSVIPILGLEFADFGTLEDCLQDLRSYSGVARKSHLSLDIALGIAAIHSIGLVHGDLKPRNILVSHHPSRQVVAQISDLTGVAVAPSYGANDFAVGTPTWQSPEAIQRHSNTDWQLADVYSFGMIVATMWSTEGFIPAGGTFLDPLLQYQLNSATKRAFVESVKLVPDQDEGSMIQLACGSMPPSSITRISLSLVAKSTLSRHQRNRKSMQDLLTFYFSPWAEVAGRRVPCQSATNPKHASTPVQWSDSLVHSIDVRCSSFNKRSSAFKVNFFRTLLSAGERIKQSLPSQTLTDMDDNVTCTGSDMLWYINLINIMNLGKFHCSERVISTIRSLGFAYIWGLGVDADEQAGLEWLAVAARLGGQTEHQTMFCLMEESAERRLSMELPRRLWCAITMLHPSGVAAAAYLRDTHPALHASLKATSAADAWFVTNRLLVSILQAVPSYCDLAGRYLDPHRLYGSDQSMALHLCARAGDQLSVEHLVREKQADIEAVTTANETPIFDAVRGGRSRVVKYLCQQGAKTHYINKDGLTILHLLPLMDDAQAAELAPMLISGGAKLHHAAVENAMSTSRRRGLPFDAVGTPLFWAALKCRPTLFAKLLSLHCAIGERLSIPDYTTLIYVVSVCHHSDMLSMAVKAEPHLVHKDPQVTNMASYSQFWQEMEINNPFAGITRAPGSPVLGPDEYTLALQISLNEGPSFNLFRRIHLRKAFRQARLGTINLLLSLGANPGLPIRENGGLTISLCTAITRKDTHLFIVFVDGIRSKGIDVLAILSNLDLFDGCTALQRAIDDDARGIFLFLMERYPSLVNIPTRVGFTALHFAAMRAWPSYARELLSHGADPYAEAENGDRPFTRAIAINPDAESSGQIAEMIYNNADRNRILGPDQRGAGLTAFGYLLILRSIPVDRIERFIRRYGNPSYHAMPSYGGSVFGLLLGVNSWPTMPSQKAVSAQRGAVMEILVKTFPSKINTCDIVHQGVAFTPLQFAAYNGDISAVEVLVKHGAKLDLEACGPEGILAGHTAVGLALLRKSKDECPPWVLRGGRREKEIFNSHIERIIELLVRYGVQTAGSGADSITRGQLSLILHPDRSIFPKLSWPNAAARYCIRKSQGDWPRMMPWEGNGVSPLQDDAVETIRPNGLSDVSTLAEFRNLDTGCLAAHGAQPGNYGRPAAEPPNDFGDQMQTQLKERWKDWRSAM